MLLIGCRAWFSGDSSTRPAPARTPGIGSQRGSELGDHAKRMITSADLEGLPGLRRAAAVAILEQQSQTVLEAIQLPDVGRKTARVLLMPVSSWTRRTPCIGASAT